MKWKTKILLLALLVLSGSNIYAFQRGEVRDISGKRLQVSNNLLSVTVLPEYSGRIASLRLANGIELLASPQISETVETPLFSYKSDNGYGLVERFWKVKSRADVPGHGYIDGNKLYFTLNRCGGTELELERVIVLPANSLEVVVNVSYSNPGEKNLSLRPWLNIIGTIPSRALIPVQGTAERQGFPALRKSVVPYLFSDGGGNNFLPPGDSWIGIEAMDKMTVWAFCLPEEGLCNSGIFYSFGNRNNGMQTSEVILPEMVIPAGGKSGFSYRILVFPGIKQLNAVLGSTGIAFTPGKLTAVAAKEEKARSFTLVYRPAGENSDRSFRIDLPEMKSGEKQEVILPFSSVPEEAFLQSDSIAVRLFFRK